MAMELSIIAQFDEIRRCADVLRDGTAEMEFMKFAQLQDECRNQWLKAVLEAQRLQRELDAALRGMSDLESKLFHARKLLEEENKARKHAEYERDAMEKKMFKVCEIVRNEHDIKDETKERLAFMNAYSYKRKSAADRTTDKYGNDINSTGSFLSDLSLTQSEEDYLNVKTSRSSGLRPHRPSTAHNASSGAVFAGNKRTRVSQDASKTKKSVGESRKVFELGPNEKIVAHTKVSVPQDDGPILAESIIHAVPPPPSTPAQHVERSSKGLTEHRADVQEAKENISPNKFKTPTKADSKPSRMHLYTPSAPPIDEVDPSFRNSTFTPTVKRSFMRQHVFTGKTHAFLKSETCAQCQQRIRFGSVGLRCRDCKAVVHSDCRDLLSIPCVPQSAGTPTSKGGNQPGFLSDYTPNVGPMIPGLIVHCVHEIETRGLTEVGIYRVPGSEREVRLLKEKFLSGKTVPHLGTVDINVLCGCVKDFLRSLREPLIPLALWKDFSNAVQAISTKQKQKELFDAIEKLPQPNRDTLAYLIQHFQRIAECKEVKMPLENLARVFAPTIVGYSSSDLDAHATFAETVIQFNILESLLNISTDYWSQFVNVEEPSPEEDETKSYSVLNAKSYLGTPLLKSGRKERKYYATPPYPSSKKK